MSVYTESMTHCPDCGTAVGELHLQHCDIEPCPCCARQLLSCKCSDEELTKYDRLPWTGMLHGEAEAIENGWYARLVEDQGWIPCEKEEPGAIPDRNRVLMTHYWDPDARQWKMSTSHGLVCPECRNTGLFRVTYSIPLDLNEDGFVLEHPEDTAADFLHCASLEIICGGGAITCLKCGYEGDEPDFGSD